MTTNIKRLIDLKFGTHRGALTEAAKAMNVNYSYLSNMAAGRVPTPDKYVAQLEAMPNCQPEDSFSVINGAGDTRVSVVIPAPIVAFLDGVAVQRGYGDALTQDNAEAVITHVLAFAQFNLTGVDPFDEDDTNLDPLA